MIAIEMKKEETMRDKYIKLVEQEKALLQQLEDVRAEMERLLSQE